MHVRPAAHTARHLTAARPPTSPPARPSSPAQAAPALRSLQEFFVGALERGELSTRPPAAPAVAGQAGPAAVFAAWLRRQYAAFLSAALRLLAAPAADARTQVAALAALMECVRGEEAGAFNNELYGRLLAAAVRGAGVRPEVLGALAAKYLPGERGGG